MLCFDQTNVYLKPVTFLPVTMLDQKDFLRVFGYLTMKVPLKFCLSVARSKSNALLNLFSKI